MSGLRPARPEDAHLIAELHTRSWQSAYRGILPDAYLDGALADDKRAHWQRVLAAPPPGAVILIAMTDGRAVGFVAGYAEPPDGALIENLHVLRGLRGKGIGRRLLEAAASTLHRGGARRMRLEVFQDNAPAIRFYQRLGGRIVGHGVHRVGGVAAPDCEVAWPDLRPLLDGGGCPDAATGHLVDESAAGQDPAGTTTGRQP